MTRQEKVYAKVCDEVSSKWNIVYSSLTAQLMEVARKEGSQS